MVTRTAARALPPIAAVAAVLTLAGCSGSGEVNTIDTTASTLIVEPAPSTSSVITIPGATTTVVPGSTDSTLAATVAPTTVQANVVSPSTGGGGTTATTARPRVTAGGNYTVKSGDSLYGIAEANGVRLRDLLALNGLAPDAKILPGDVIKLPTATFSGGETSTSTTAATTSTTAKPATGNGGTYTVKSGDSLYGIAVANGVRLADLLAANGLTESSPIKPGDVLKLPAGAITAPATGTTVKGTPAPAGGTYEIKQGDTLFGIAQRFGVTLEDLLKANGFTTSTVITPGSRIKIPQG